jgi:5-keto 4-deoxyuronate isomerase
MQIRFQNSPKETSQMNTQQLRDNFLVQGLMQPDTIQLTYSHYDRMIIGGAVPTTAAISLLTEEELKANFFLERREMGIINVGGKGTVTADGVAYEIDKLECVYLGKGTKDIFIFYQFRPIKLIPIKKCQKMKRLPLTWAIFLLQTKERFTNTFTMMVYQVASWLWV